MSRCPVSSYVRRADSGTFSAGRCGDLVSLAKSSSERGVGHSAETRRGLVGAVDSTADAVTSHRPRLDAALPVTPRACSRATAPSLCFVWE